MSVCVCVCVVCVCVFLTVSDRGLWVVLDFPEHVTGVCFG